MSSVEATATGLSTTATSTCGGSTSSTRTATSGSSARGSGSRSIGTYHRWGQGVPEVRTRQLRASEVRPPRVRRELRRRRNDDRRPRRAKRACRRGSTGAPRFTVGEQARVPDGSRRVDAVGAGRTGPVVSQRASTVTPTGWAGWRVICGARSRSSGSVTAYRRLIVAIDSWASTIAKALPIQRRRPPPKG